MPFAAGQMPAVLLLLGLAASAAGAQLEAAARTAAAQDGQRPWVAEDELEAAKKATLMRNGGLLPPRQMMRREQVAPDYHEFMNFDPVWAYGDPPICELLHHKFEPAMVTAEPPNNYIYCDRGGQSYRGPSGDLLFKDAPLPQPPMTISATISSKTLGGFQVFLGWSHADFLDGAQFRLTATCNVQYGINDGFAWHHVEAKPAINLCDGHMHHVAVVRDANGLADLFLNGTRVGFGPIAGNTRVTLTTARAATFKHGLWDLPFEGNVTQVIIYDRALQWWEVSKVPFVPCIHQEEPVMTRIDLTDSAVRRNLGGAGPDFNSDLAGPYGLRFENVATYGGIALDLLVTNTTPYQPHRPAVNGLLNDESTIGHVNIKTGTSAGLRFELVAYQSFYPVKVDNFYFVFMDIDSGPYGTGRESLTFTTDVTNFYIAHDSTLHHSYPTALTNLVVWAGNSGMGDNRNNPTDAMDLDDEQEKRGIFMVFAQTSGFEVLLNSTPGMGGRDVSFAGWSTLQMDTFNTTLLQGAPQTARDVVHLGFSEQHDATGDGLAAGTWE